MIKYNIQIIFNKYLNTYQFHINGFLENYAAFFFINSKTVIFVLYLNKTGIKNLYNFKNVKQVQFTSVFDFYICTQVYNKKNTIN